MSYPNTRYSNEAPSSHPLLSPYEAYTMSRPNHFEQASQQPQQQQQQRSESNDTHYSSSSDNTLTPSSSYANALPKVEAGGGIGGTGTEPPSLGYSLHEHKKAIAITWSVIVTSSGILPILLYWVLTRTTDLDLAVVFAVSSAISAVSILDFFVRLWKLLRPEPGSDDDRRALNQGGRWAWDMFQIEFGLGIVVITAMFVVGNSVGPNMRLLSMPAPWLMTWVGAQLLLLAIPAALGARNPFAISSVPRGAPVRPVAYVLIEDIVAVNGGGRQAYRQRLDARYQVSPVFRQLLAEVSVAWGLLGTGVGTVLLALIWTIDQEVAYTLAWSVPWVAAGLGAWATIAWTRKRLADEKAWFAGAPM